MEVAVPRRENVLGVLNFFGLWLRRPRSIGAIVPSSRRLAAAIADEVDFTVPGVVVELGGGTGSITRALLARAAHPDEVVVVEREASLCDLLAARFPGVRVIRGDARNLKGLLRAAGIGPVKAIVSGLPLRSLSGRCHDAIIRAAFSVLAPGGVFVQFTYGLAAPVRRALVGRDGLIGRRSRWVLANLPPAALWRYRRRTAPAPSVAGAQPILVALLPASSARASVAKPGPMIETRLSAGLTRVEAPGA